MNEQYLEDAAAGAKLKTDAASASVLRSFGVRFDWSAAQATLGTTTAVRAAVTDTGADQEITTSITNPSCPRNLTVTFGGTAGDIKAITVTVYGTNYNDERISEGFLATVNTANTVTGSKAFKTVDRIVIPAHDGTGATTAVGVGAKLGLPYKMSRNTHQMTFLADVIEGTAPTLAASSTVLESNTITLNSALNGTAVKSYWLLP